MRVLMIGFDPTILGTGSSEPGDTRERHLKYAAALRRRYPDGDIQVIVKAPRSWSPRRTDIGEGLSVHPVPCTRAGFAIGAFRLASTLSRRARIDVVTTQTPFDDGLVGVALKRRHGAALNVQMRSSFLNMPTWTRERPVVYAGFNRLGQWVARHADTVRVVSHGEKARLEQGFPHLREKVVCLPPLVNRTVFEEPIRRQELEEARATLAQRGLEGARLLLFVGRLVAQKNLGTLLRAFALASRTVPGSVLVIAGNGPQRARLGRLAVAMRIQQRVVWLGTLPLRSLRAWYALAAGVVLPSFHEGFGKVIVEAYLMEAPVLVTPFVSAHELVADGETGFIAPVFDDAAWMAERMTFLLQHPTEARAMGRRGAAHLRTYLLPEETYLDRLIDIWRDTAAMARRGS